MDAHFETLTKLYPHDAIFVVDGDRKIRFWSEGATRLLGFEANEVLGEHCLKANRCSNCLRGCGMAELGTVGDVPLVMFRRDGQKVRVLKTAQAFWGPDGTFQGGVEVLRPDPSAPSHFSDTTMFHGMVSRSDSMRALFQVIQQVAESDAAVVVTGEIGSGKELAARAVHAVSRRSSGAFVVVNCAALTPHMAESTLFGHREGAFPGASANRDGFFVEADGGTLFLDDVTALDLEIQGKLLRVLEDGEVRPVGADDPRTVNVRVVAGTTRHLAEVVEAGAFREDLMFRLRVVPIDLPPLRNRSSDIEPLLWRFLGEEADRGSRAVTEVEPDAMRALFEYRWPGNVRELRNVVQYACAVGSGHRLSLRELPAELRRHRGSGEGVPRDDLPTPPTESDTERQRILWALSQQPHDLEAASRLLGISRATFWRRRKKYGLA
ncbi:MAG: sigma-54 interaction domain-containing protein [Myxococcota bacterium]